MAYRVALPKNKEDFPQKAQSPSSVSLLKNTGNTGNTGNKPADSDRPNGVIGDGASVVDQILDGDELVAVLICSKILEAHIWLVFSDDFNPADGQAIYYADEMEFLKTKTPEQLRAIHKRETTTQIARAMIEART